MLRTAVFALLLCTATSASANQEAERVAINAGDFAAQRAQIEKDLADGKTYAEISQGDRAKVRESMDRISGALEGAASVDALADEVKVRVFNDQEEINLILTQAEADSRLVCQRYKPTGSNRNVTTCETVAERERRMLYDQDTLRQNQRSQMPQRN